MVPWSWYNAHTSLVIFDFGKRKSSLSVCRFFYFEFEKMIDELCRPEDALGAKLSSLFIWTFLKYTLTSMRLLVYSLSFIFIIMSLKSALSFIIIEPALFFITGTSTTFINESGSLP